jgi:hypothetical protein
VKPRRVLEVVTSALVLFALGRACLPQTTLPEPGNLSVTVTASDAFTNGFTTNDGWKITFQRALVGVGRASLDGDKVTTYCNLYPDSHYNRLLDMLRPGPQKLALIYSLGHCDFSFALQRVSANTVRGEGVSIEDQILMSTLASDPWVKNERVSCFVEGRAEKAGAQKHFAWPFRERIAYSGCGLSGTDGGTHGLTLNGGQSSSVDIRIHGEALFERKPGTTWSLVFQPFADADDVSGDGNGEITLDELHGAPLDSSVVVPEDGGVDAATITTLGDFVYKFTLPEMARFDEDGHCAYERNL